jgi:hypothetical protein
VRLRNEAEREAKSAEKRGPKGDRRKSAKPQLINYIGIYENQCRRGWERAVGYGKRSLVETAMFRYKVLIGPTLRARKFETQKSEARMACAMINRMTQLGRPISQRIA